MSPPQSPVGNSQEREEVQEHNVVEEVDRIEEEGNTNTNLDRIEEDLEEGRIDEEKEKNDISYDYGDADFGEFSN